MRPAITFLNIQLSNSRFLLMLMGFFGKFTLKVKRAARLDSSPRRSAFFCYTSRGKPHYFRQSYNNCIVL